MSSDLFKIEEHVVPCQHIREYRGAAANAQEDVFKLHVKQYIPLSNLNPQAGDVTVLGAAGNGFVKELYEPLWDELLSLSANNGFRIRSIWIADAAWQGQSSVLNEDVLGNDPNWLDHSRDLLHLVNLKRDQMPQPIVGVGHSMGGAQLTQLALLHPRLLYTLVLLDPVIEYRLNDSAHDGHRGITRQSTYRRDLWPSREAAEASIRNSPFFQTWEPRVLDRYMKHALRDTPTAIYPSAHPDTYQPYPSASPAVTLKTTKHQEVFSFMRPNYDFDPAADDHSTLNRTKYPDFDPSVPTSRPFYSPAGHYVMRHLHELRPSVLYVLGEVSNIMSDPILRDRRANETGIGIGGSGGVAAGRVESLTLEGCGHLFPMEHVKKAAEPAARWLGKELKRWRDEDEDFRRVWDKKSRIEKLTVDERWLEMMGADPRKEKTRSEKL